MLTFHLTVICGWFWRWSWDHNIIVSGIFFFISTTVVQFGLVIKMSLNIFKCFIVFHYILLYWHSNTFRTLEYKTVNYLDYMFYLKQRVPTYSKHVHFVLGGEKIVRQKTLFFSLLWLFQPCPLLQWPGRSYYCLCLFEGVWKCDR